MDGRRAAQGRAGGRTPGLHPAPRRHTAPTGDHLGRAVGDEIYIRSAYGRGNGWFRRALAYPRGHIRAGGVEKDVTFVEPASDVHTAIDQAYHAKYDRYGPAIVGTVTGPNGASATFRIDPREV